MEFPQKGILRVNWVEYDVVGGLTSLVTFNKRVDECDAVTEYGIAQANNSKNPYTTEEGIREALLI